MQQAAEATLETSTDTDAVVKLSWCLVLLEPQLSLPTDLPVCWWRPFLVICSSPPKALPSLSSLSSPLFSPSSLSLLVSTFPSPLHVSRFLLILAL